MTRLVPRDVEPATCAVQQGDLTHLAPAEEARDFRERLDDAVFRAPALPGASLPLPPWHPSCHG